MDNVIDFPRFVPSKQGCTVFLWSVVRSFRIFFRLERFLQDQAGAGLGWRCRCDGVDWLDYYGWLELDYCC